MSTVIPLSGGVWTFMAIVVAWGLFTLITLYTRGGSAINQRAWSNPRVGQGGASGASVLDHDREAARALTRGTRP